MPGHILVYLTANDKRTFLKDSIHFYHSARFNPGVGAIELYFVVSEVRPLTKTDRRIINGLTGLIESGNKIKVTTVIIKPNLGRDFSSLHMALLQMKSIASPDDYILIRNRTSWGPLKDGWYLDFIRQANRFDNIAITGCTINLADHPKRSRILNVAHVQTYAYLSQWKYLSTLIPDFPGIHALNREEAIMDGEIELSQRFMQRGWSITSLYQPDLVVNKSNQNEPFDFYALQHVNMKSLPIVRKAGEDRNQYIGRVFIAFWRMVRMSMTGKNKTKWIEMRDSAF